MDDDMKLWPYGCSSCIVTWPRPCRVHGYVTDMPRWWICRHCGRHGSALNVGEEKARCLAHEAECPSRAKVVEHG